MAEINTAALRARGGSDARVLSVTGRGRADTGAYGGRQKRSRA